MKTISDRKKRFNPSSFCRASCLDEISYFFTKNIPEEEKVLKVSNTLKTLDFLKESKLCFFIHLPHISLISPFALHLWLLYKKHITFSLQEFIIKINSAEKKCILYNLTSYQLYLIKEDWTHCVCEFFDDSKRFYYDIYLEKLEVDYPSIKNYSPPSHEELMNYLSIKILIWSIY